MERDDRKKIVGKVREEEEQRSGMWVFEKIQVLMLTFSIIFHVVLNQET